MLLNKICYILLLLSVITHAGQAADQRFGSSVYRGNLVRDIEILSDQNQNQAKRVLAALSLGESSRKEAVTALLDALNDPAPLVRAVCAEALGNMKDPDAADSLIRLLENDTDKSVRIAAASALFKYRNNKARAALKKAGYTSVDALLLDAGPEKPISGKPPEPMPSKNRPPSGIPSVIQVYLAAGGFMPTEIFTTPSTRSEIELYSTPMPDFLKIPAQHRKERRFGLIAIGTQTPNHYCVMVDFDRIDAPDIWFDQNQNGDLTDDNGPLPKSPDNPSDAFAALSYKRLFKEVDIKGDYHMRLSAPLVLLAVNKMARFSRMAFKGWVAVQNQLYACLVTDTLTHDADYTNDGILIDFNLDGQFDPKDEAILPNQAIIINGETIRFRVDW